MEYWSVDLQTGNENIWTFKAILCSVMKEEQHNSDFPLLHHSRGQSNSEETFEALSGSKSKPGSLDLIFTILAKKGVPWSRRATIFIKT